MSIADRRRWHLLERLLFVAGMACLVWVAFVTVRAEHYKRTHPVSFTERASAATPTSAHGPISIDAGVGPDGVVGVLEIPRLELSEPVAEGDDDGTLAVAIGHLPDTPLPWRGGNSVLAAHRDTHFRALRTILIGDRLTLRTPHGVFEYRVADKMIVDPDDVWVLAPSEGRRLTLVTCYPFSYVGNAPQRFIVRAEEVPAP
jgi:sortase A